jgi:hypothetical protein
MTLVGGNSLPGWTLHDNANPSLASIASVQVPQNLHTLLTIPIVQDPLENLGIFTRWHGLEKSPQRSQSSPSVQRLPNNGSQLVAKRVEPMLGRRSV